MEVRLKELRNVLGLKRREFAEKLGISYSSLSNLENGCDKISKARIYQICKEFNVNRHWFETGEGEMFEPEPEKEMPTVEQAVRTLAICLFNYLSPRGQDAVIKWLREFIEEQKRKKDEEK